MIAERGAWVLLIAIAIGGCRKESADASASANASANASADADARAKARRVVVTARVPGIGYAAVTRAREVVSGGVGLADLAPRIEAGGDTVFEAASIAKTVIAACVMQLVEERLLDLDVDAGRYLGFEIKHPRFDDPITLRMLLTHRASIRDRDDELLAGGDDLPLSPFLQRYVRGPGATAFLDARPGTTTTYSNVGAALAALAVERVAGESFVDYSQRRVFEPLRMKSTGWRAPSRDRFVVATPHALRDGRFVALPQAAHAVYPVVDLRSSAHDLARFARAILCEGELDGARVLSPTSVRTMLAGGADGGDPDQALAWQLRTIGGRRVAGHEGEDAGATTALFLDLAAGTGAIVLANGDAFGSGDRERAGAIQGLVADLLATAKSR